MLIVSPAALQMAQRWAKDKDDRGASVPWWMWLITWGLLVGSVVGCGAIIAVGMGFA